MQKSIRISVEDKKLIEKIAKKDDRFEYAVLSSAIKNYAKSKKVLK